MKKVTTLIFVLIISTLSLTGQQITHDSIQSNKSTKDKKADFTVMPYLSYNRNLKFMFGAIPMVMYKLDKNDSISAKSISGLSVVYTTNKSHIIAFFNKWYFKEDNWRGTFFAVTGSFNSQFFVNGFQISDFYDFATDATIVSAGIQRKIIKKLYGGLTYTYANYKTNFEDNIQPSTNTITNGIELNLLLDTRNAVYYPTSGAYTQLKFISYPEWFGNDVKANKISAEYNTYFSSRNNTDVIAARFSSKIGLGNIAFEQQEVIGGKDIRGYSEGKFRGDGIIALQGEYRYNFDNKMGLVAFAGLATIYGADNADFDWKAYPGGGVGYRYAAFKKVKFNIGLDAALGKEDWGIYFRIGEAF
ncbi:BamA/TamA family outer membrane protein [Tamlana fucoidanivorans]|uniref:Bacterial surface antigen (D15) domain-containing protein n=1 Tax=Allotamlana fucoidanivorans TaxID=2583814 RepID=A0A5C4SQ37_9FLAO|nr:BamA/TamA family outer membrane protein [Tamlana fucoidanivorans]TNJ46416.1 hypothetical protein FGF67_01980 [Tamlana fucoidanivorans]